MKIGDRLRHKTGMIGTVKRFDMGWMFVMWDGMSLAMPTKETWVTKIEEEGEHGQQSSD